MIGSTPMNRSTGISVPMHIDGASGGFVNPFLVSRLQMGFPPSASAVHQRLWTQIWTGPAGSRLDHLQRPQNVQRRPDFLCELPRRGSATATLNFSKSSATILVQYYAFLRLGREGYTRVMRHALEHAQYLRDRLTKGGRFQVMNKTQRIPVVALTLDKSVTRYNEFDISNKVRERGWILAAYSMPPDAQAINVCGSWFVHT